MSEKKLSEQELSDLWSLKESVEGLIHSLNRLHPDFLESEAALKELLKWTPEYVDTEKFKESPHYEEGDEKAPFFTEAFLYNLLGKSDARNLLSLMKRALGIRGIGSGSEMKTMNNTVIRKVSVLQGMAKALAKKQGLKPDDLVILTVSIEKVVGAPVQFLLSKIESSTARDEK